MRRPQDNITGRTYLERERPVVVLIRRNDKSPRNVLIQREDGSRVVRPFRGLGVPTKPTTADREQMAMMIAVRLASVDPLSAA
jgi:acetyl esterase